MKQLNMSKPRTISDYEKLCNEIDGEGDDYWRKLADRLSWMTPYQQVRDYHDDNSSPHWYTGGALNASYQCCDRQLDKRANQTAITWIPETGDSVDITYQTLTDNVARLANALTGTFHIQKGDRVVIYMPMIPEAIYAMLACARIGAIHVVVFGGFSAEVLAERIIDTEAKLVITADGAFRRGKPYMLKPIVDEALMKHGIESCKQVLVVKRNGEPITRVKGRDFDYHTIVGKYPTTFDPVPVQSDDPLFILHTSGSTGKPKGIVHSTAGYLAWAQETFLRTFDYEPGDIYWCTADFGWITGHTYNVYGPLSSGAAIVLYEGTLDYPTIGRWWDIIATHRVTQFYTSPTALRLLKRDGVDEPSMHDLGSLRILGSVGEPIDASTKEWYLREVGRSNCPIVDTWWQTETGGHLISMPPTLTGVGDIDGNLPLPGIHAEVLDDKGNPVAPGMRGYLCITEPWPGMAQTIWGDTERFVRSYLQEIPASARHPFVYTTGDAAVADTHGAITILGRTDDVMNISGHRVGSAEVETVLTSHEHIAEAAVIGRPDPLTGEHLVAYIVPVIDIVDRPRLHLEINQLLATEIGKIVQIRSLTVVSGLPKTRSGKIVRRILKSVALGDPIAQDISTLENPDIVSVLLKL